MQPQSWGYDQSWRDPWGFQDRETGKFHGLITARHKEGQIQFRGAIGHGISDNLIDWQVRPPVTKPSYFGSMECPQLVELEENRYYLFFSSDACYLPISRANPIIPLGFMDCHAIFKPSLLD